ncbi:MAG: hypothetical protein AAF513_02315 [Pseudomonadota bacterium]
MRPSLILVGLLFALSGCHDAAPPLPEGVAPPVQTVPRGSTPESAGFGALAKVQRPGVDFVQLDAGIPVWLTVLERARFSPGLVGAPAQGISVATLLAQDETEDGLLIIGSGFVSQLHSLRPVGLLKQRDRVLNPLLAYGYTRILGVDPAGLSVIHKDHYEPGLFASALQVGPGIIEDGRLDIAARDMEKTPYFRSFIALCDSHWVLGISQAPSNLYNLGAALLNWAKNRGLSCQEMVNLAGDRQAVFAARFAGTTYFHGDTSTAKVSLLTFRPSR